MEKEESLMKAVKVISEWWVHMRWPRIFAQQTYFRRRNIASKAIQSHIHGFVARKKHQIDCYNKSLHQGALKLQSLYRRFKATKKVREVAHLIKYEKSIILIQTLFRRLAATGRMSKLQRLTIAALKLQCFIRCKIAKSKTFVIKCNNNVRVFQKIYRGYKDRKKVAIKKKVRYQAVTLLCTCSTHFTCKYYWMTKIRYAEKKNGCRLILQRKLKAAVLGARVRERFRLTLLAVLSIQQFFCIVLERKGIMNSKDENTSNRSIIIQKAWRGYAIRRNPNRILVAHRVKSGPLYYQIKSEYLRLQNMHHTLHVIKIQRNYRRRLAYMKVSKLRRKKFVKRIESFWYSQINVKHAKEELQILKEVQSIRSSAAAVLQSFARGMKCRMEYQKHLRAEEVKWFICEIRATGMIGRALQQFRARKRAISRAHNAATKIQSYRRGILCGRWYRQNYSRLVREREKRLRVKRNKCAIVICSKFARVYLARRRVEKKRRLLLEYELEKERLENLELSINSIHEGHLNTLYVTRVQSGMRGKLACKKVKDMALLDSDLLFRRADEIQNSSAIKIQALVRGVHYRGAHRRLLPSLKAAKTARSYCTECDNRTAKRRCRQCKDNFCQACYEKIHKNGARRLHGWDSIDLRNDHGSIIRSSSLTAQSSAVATWEEYWDESAQAAYWYNTITNEASWINPNA